MAQPQVTRNHGSSMALFTQGTSSHLEPPWPELWPFPLAIHKDMLISLCRWAICLFTQGPPLHVEADCLNFGPASRLYARTFSSLCAGGLYTTCKLALYVPLPSRSKKGGGQEVNSVLGQVIWPIWERGDFHGLSHNSTSGLSKWLLQRSYPQNNISMAVFATLLLFGPLPINFQTWTLDLLRILHEQKQPLLHPLSGFTLDFLDHFGLESLTYGEMWKLCLQTLHVSFYLHQPQTSPIYCLLTHPGKNRRECDQLDNVPEHLLFEITYSCLLVALLLFIW